MDAFSYGDSVVAGDIARLLPWVQLLLGCEHSFLMLGLEPTFLLLMNQP